MSRNSPNPAPTVQSIQIGDEEAGQRLDNFLLARLRGVPRSRIYRIVRSGEVRVNSARCKPDQRLVAGDKVRVPPVRVAEKAPQKGPGQSILRQLAGRVLYEDEALLVIDKPSGLAVHGGSGISAGLIESLRMMRPDCPSLELVHRLDRETSGCIMIAKKRAMLRHLHQGLREGDIEKTYTALVQGRWPKRRTRVVAALEKNVMKSGERMVTATAGDTGKAAETHFKVLRSYADATLVEARPLTGRTHQIRVHACVAGHPLAGDDKYGDRDFNKHMSTFGLKRLFLHASELKLRLPSGQELHVTAALDDVLSGVLERLGE